MSKLTELGPCPLCQSIKLNLFSHWTATRGQMIETPKVQCTECYCEATIEAWSARKPALPAAWLLVEALRADEAHSVTLFCDNPDFNMGPDSAVEVCGDFTDWKERRFEGDNLTAALMAAYLAKTGGKVTPEIADALKREGAHV
ncbi:MULTISPECIES: hypothetical protein [unclassified Bradyrhizobium]|uniref:hypothetical protein n=1 Tax=Bradyrhizobium sp. USDA 4541 TaxID=2817704 RepID=UPI0020A2E228|nr:hypothetical protein [Bradyrhizobium sp. USDA 4541]MCP1852880.1 hypothetical protein [Bradyrhizobium sp. USDA 4541]